MGARPPAEALLRLQGALSRGRGRRSANRPRPRGGLPRPVELPPLLPGAPLAGRLSRVPLRGGEPRAPLPPRRPDDPPGNGSRELPPLPQVGPYRAGSRRAGPQADELRDVPPPREGP